jgi:AraC-like DNA-binding protein
MEHQALFRDDDRVFEAFVQGARAMTYHQAVESGLQARMSWIDPAAAKPQVSLRMLEGILDDVRQALAHDRGAAQAGIARLSAILDAGGIEPAAPAYARGGFAPWQKRRVEAYLNANLEHSVRIKKLSEMVSLSASHFCRAFKQSFGTTPHTHLTGLRVERAKQMMVSTAEPLSQIALACGLADQAHLSKVFRRFVGQTPSVWRRLNEQGASA